MSIGISSPVRRSRRRLTSPVVQAVTRLIRFRNTHPAFDGAYTVFGRGSRITATWTAGNQSAELDADVATGSATITWTAVDGTTWTTPLSALP